MRTPRSRWLAYIMARAMKTTIHITPTMNTICAMKPTTGVETQFHSSPAQVVKVCCSPGAERLSGVYSPMTRP